MITISELGLELIELEDQGLLVESKVGNGKLNDWVKLSIPEIQRVEEWNKDLVLFCNKIVASTKQLDGLPLLVIEDEVEKWINESTSTLKDVHTINVSKMCLNAGYNKAKKKFKFTEEDLRKAYNQGGRDMHDRCISHNWRGVYKSVNINEFVKLRQKFLQSITKKELWIEIEYKDLTGKWYAVDGFVNIKNPNFEPLGLRPRIIEGKIKAIFK